MECKDEVEFFGMSINVLSQTFIYCSLISTNQFLHLKAFEFHSSNSSWRNWVEFVLCDMESAIGVGCGYVSKCSNSSKSYVKDMGT